MNYIKVPKSNTHTAKERTIEFSRQLYKLTRPHPDPNDVTEFLFGFIENHELEEAALECDPDALIYISPNADPSNLITLLEPTNEQSLEMAQILNMIEQAKGNTISFGQLIPSWINLKTKEDLELEGWPAFPAVQTETRSLEELELLNANHFEGDSGI